MSRFEWTTDESSRWRLAIEQPAGPLLSRNHVGALICLLAGLAAGFACSSSGTRHSDGSAAIDASRTEAAVDRAQDSTALPSGDGGLASSDGGLASGDGSVASVDGSGCPVYQAPCNGRCIPVRVDPDNCGGCGIQCGSGQVCSGGVCTAACMVGSSVCGRECVDVRSDSRHCGGCDKACGTGMGCVEGSCKESVPLGPAPTCPVRGPLIGTGMPGIRSCAGNLAQTTFRWALCSCTDIDVSDKLRTDAYDSTRSPYVPGELGGGVGLNGSFQSSAGVEIGGALWDSAATGFKSSANVTVKQELHVAGPVKTSSGFTVGTDAWIDGDVSASSRFSVTKTLRVPADATVDNNVSYGSLLRGPVTVPPVCDCAPNQLVPVAAIVAAHQLDNDNAAIGLDPSLLVGPKKDTRLDLPCGRYYLDGISGSSDITVAIHSRTLLFIGGDVKLSSVLRFAVDPSAELDVFIAGSLSSSNQFSIGSPSYPAATRFYIQGKAGQDAFRISNKSLLGAFFYAAEGPVSASDSLEAFGGIIAGTFHNSASTSIHYDRAVLVAGDECDPPVTPTPDGGVPTHPVDASTPNTCSSCLDCGNQACINGACGACTDSSQCCAPLVCYGGRCQAQIIQ